MRTWNANLASAGRWLAKGCFANRRFAKTSAVLAAFLLAVGQALAQTDESGGEAKAAKNKS